MKEVEHYLKGVPIVLVGTKSDLRADTAFLAAKKVTPVSTEEGQKLAADIGARYVECSAKTRDGVKNVFDQAIKAVLAKQKKKSSGCVML